MVPVFHQIFHTARLVVLAIAVGFGCVGPSGSFAQAPGDATGRGGSVFDRQDKGPVLEHAPIDDPATIDASRAEQIYRSILPQMQAAYAASGDPLIWAYPRWQRYNSAPYRSHTHGMVFVNNYANDIAKAYGRLDEVDSLPEGSLIVKDSFVVTESGDIRVGALGIMQKMSTGYDTENGDWLYLVIEPGGALVGVSASEGIDPRMTQCAGCHNAAPEGQDRLYFVPDDVRR